MRRFAWKLCFAMFSVWFLTVGIAAVADQALSADSGAGDSVAKESQTLVLPPTPEAASQVASDAAFQIKEETFEASAGASKVIEVDPQILKSLPKGAEIVPMNSGAAPPASGAAPQASGAAPQASGTAAQASEAAAQASGTAPQASETAAQASEAAAQASGTAPQASEAAAQASEAAAQASEAAAQASEAAPQASGAAPQASGTAPQASGTAPQASGTAPQVAGEKAGKPKAAPSPPILKENGGFFVKFNNANLYEVIHTLAANAGINYMIDPRVKGVVNVHTQGMLQKSSALELLFTILRVNGATAVKEGETYHILPMTDARMEPLTPSITGDNTMKGVPGQVNMRVYPLHFISVAEMSVTVKPFLSPAGEMTEVPRSNTLLVVDTEANLDKIARLVEILDSDVFRSAGVKLFKLKTMDPDEMVKNLETIFKALDFSTSGLKPSGINFVPISKLSSILVVSASPRVLADVEKWVEELDKPGGSSTRSVHRYRIRFGKVADIAAILSQLYPTQRALAEGAMRTEFRTSISQPIGQSAASGADFAGQSDASYQGGGGAAPQSSRSSMGARSMGSSSSSFSSGSSTSPTSRSRRGRGRDDEEEEAKPFDIIPDEATNSLIARATLAEYTELLSILKTVDVYPQQVLLEVLVGEVNLSDDMKLGISWQWSGTSVTGNKRDVFHTLTMAESGFQNNFSYFVEKTNRLGALFKSLAEDGRASILSSPSVIAANGKTSTINVVDQIPITSSVLNSATNPPVTTTSVEYRDVGVILNFTPFINDEGLVTMEIEQEVSDISGGSTATGNPSFFKRSISTNLVASQDQSIVLGGLVKEKKSRDRSGLPFFYKIPIIGWLFGAREDSISRSELLIFITPRVIRSVEEGVNLSKEFEDRVSELKARIVEAKGIRGN